MKRNFAPLILLCLCLPASAQSKLQGPEDFLGYALGDRFTPHHLAVAYFKAVDEALPNVQIIQYGETNEHRPLIYAILTSPENFKNLEQIRSDNLRRAGLAYGAPSENKVAIVWLSYGVHGNEASSTEAAMKTLYDLVNPTQTSSQEWLKNTVVIIDPCINPDGRERYVNFYDQHRNNPATPDPQSIEHREPWPGGRGNHYLFDLNRDWAWETQIESQARLKVYNQWLPHVHVDFHEQNPGTPYYFAPAAEPYHTEITPWQREFQKIIGKNNAKRFDEQGWLYFTKERFDLYYPGYGDTYPMFNGAIGMTYEKGGGGSAGLTITTSEGDPVTLKDRLLHHYTTSISTVETSSKNALRLVDEFQKYFREGNVPSSSYKTYLIRSDNNLDNLNAIKAWMSSHSIQFGHPANARPLTGFDFQTQSVAHYTISTSDIVIPVDQPKGRLVTTFFEPQPKLADSLTYDITAWNLIYAFNLKAFALNEKVAATKLVQLNTVTTDPIPANPYAYIFRYQSLKDVEFLAALIQKGVKVRSSKKSFSTANQDFDAGTIIVTRRNNETVSNFDLLLQATAKKMGRQLYTSTTGFVDKGMDFGSNTFNYLTPPKVALLSGDQTSSTGFGEIWHYFEQQIHYPVSVIRTDLFKSIDLSQYSLLIIPEGSYTIFDDPTLEIVLRWTTAGGRLIIIGEGLNSFVDKKGLGLKVYASDQNKKEAEDKDKTEKEKEGLLQYGDIERKQLSQSMPGAIYKVTLDKSHPLAFGLGNSYYTLKINKLHFEFLESGWNVGTLLGKAKPILGFAGYKINRKMDNTLVFGVENKGKGQIIYLVDDPLFRSFWETGKMLFSNAVFMGY